MMRPLDERNTRPPAPNDSAGYFRDCFVTAPRARRPVRTRRRAAPPTSVPTARRIGRLKVGPPWSRRLQKGPVWARSGHCDFRNKGEQWSRRWNGTHRPVAAKKRFEARNRLVPGAVDSAISADRPLRGLKELGGQVYGANAT